MSIYARAVIVLAILGAVVAAWWKAESMLADADKAGYDRAQAEAHDAAEAQAVRNRDLQRAAELRYTVTAQARERVITEIQTEVRYVTLHLETCPLGSAAVRLLNRAAQCAREDRSAGCGAGDGLPNAKATP